jgi:hypothetical protein
LAAEVEVEVVDRMEAGVELGEMCVVWWRV